jgi:hypothetical protein
MKTNTRKPSIRTKEGGIAKHISVKQQLRRSVLSCLLWEREFYEDGQTITDRIDALVAASKPEDVAALAVEARSQFHLRHVPLFLLCSLAKHHGTTSEAVAATIQRVDEIAELVALWWKDGKKPLPAQMKKGIGAAFNKFSSYQFQKYAGGDGAVRLRDVMFLVHPKPKDAEQAEVFKAIADRMLLPADTWEVALSAGADKKATFERMIAEGQLGYLALLRNLRGMVEAGVDTSMIRTAIRERVGARRVLPFRYVAAARACPTLEPDIDAALGAAIGELPTLSGHTLVLVDVSGSMDYPLSARSDLRRIDAAAALGSIVNAESLRVFSFSDRLVEVPPRRGMAGVDVLIGSQSHNGTALGAAVQAVNSLPHDRLIVITDEQSHDAVPDPVAKRAYMINVASNQNGVGYGKWTHIDGFTEGVLRFIHEIEGSDAT